MAAASSASIESRAEMRRGLAVTAVSAARGRLLGNPLRLRP